MLNFKCILTIWDSSVENSLFKSVPHILTGLFDILVSSFLHNLDISPLSDMELVKIFSHSIGCHFVLLTVSLSLQNLFSFKRLHILILNLNVCAAEVVYCLNVLKAISNFLFYQLKCNWTYAEIFDPLGLEFSANW